MTYPKVLLISVLGVGTIVTGFAFHDHIVKVRAARLEHAVPPAPYFPPGSIWTTDISHAPVDPQSDTIISWLADAGGWGDGNKMQVDLASGCCRQMPPLRKFPFIKAQGFIPPIPTSDLTFPLPAGGGMEGEPGYQCNVDQADCHLIVVDRSHDKLYEAYQANYDGPCSTAQIRRGMGSQPRLSAVGPRRTVHQRRRRRFPHRSAALQCG